ncbi:MAG: hypothetical protein MMC33_002594, partial [Icmadophila ericetorum]|nr:hypothetical protein [Icmadophila ericetorum]
MADSAELDPVPPTETSEPKQNDALEEPTDARQHEEMYDSDEGLSESDDGSDDGAE